MPGSPTRLADFVPYRMAITSNAVSGLIAGEYRNEFGLKIPEWRIMAVLGDAGQLTQRDLVRLTLMDKVAVNRACKILEERGLLRRSPNAADGRSHHLELTGEGRAMHGKIWPQALDIYERIFAALSAREIEKLRVLLDKLLSSVQALEGDSR
ncbi:MarR family winged helix-turn-helix transcriptional regulator [Novosphingobium huizhouense]|uniref:MarR family winged helix-turn-helix transcriptional regulator n=1 Tax=Novosphingobium huizhouense TaxID=2866625 RepID=UPI001CD81EDB|nr:MarR family winged helix-turn-helix transcriptional regulator [Novosphingobium huizhouense]